MLIFSFFSRSGFEDDEDDDEQGNDLEEGEFVDIEGDDGEKVGAINRRVVAGFGLFYLV